jgi:transposase
MNKNTNYCGIDVSKDSLDIYYQNQDDNKQHLKVDNTAIGFRKILKHVGKDTQYVMEATGVYHLNLIFFLHENNIGFSVANALQIKRFIQMHLERNKTDKKDAQRIYEYGVFYQPKVYEMPDTAYFECRSLNNAIQDMTKEMTRISNQIHSLHHTPYDTKALEKSYEKIYKNIQKERTKVEETLAQKLKDWNASQLKLVSSVKGIGPRAASELIVYTQGFKGMESYKQLISYAGLSPVSYSSGTSIKGRVRICKQGGKQLRNILYMCALNAKKTNSHCKALYDRLVAKGKNKKAAIIAVCNKLLKIVFGVVKNQTMYQELTVKNNT